MTPNRARRLVFAAVTITTLGVTSLAHAVVKTYLVRLDGAQERPTPVVTSATGDANVEVDTDANTIKLKMSYSGLSSNETAAHIHAPTPLGAPARDGVVGPLFTLPLGQVKVVTIDYSGHAQPDSIDSFLLNGRAYINVHTVNHPPGEIRGQIDDQQPGSAGSVPSMTTWSAWALALSLLGAGGWVARRRRLNA